MVIFDYSGILFELCESIDTHLIWNLPFLPLPFDIHRYPCINNRSEYNEVKVYSGAIGSARFLYGDRSLITVGGTDASLMIWELIEE